MVEELTYYQKNKVVMDNRAKLYQIKNRSVVRENKKIWDKNNPDSLRRYKVTWKIKNPDKVNKEKRKKRERDKNNPEIVLKTKCRMLANYKIKMPVNCVCEACNDKFAKEKHHEDYNKPLDVLFVCRKCHRKITNGEITEEEIAIFMLNRVRAVDTLIIERRKRILNE